MTPDHYESLGPASGRGDSAVEVFDPPRKLAHGWRSMYDPMPTRRSESRVTWEIEPDEDGVCKLTVIHDRLEALAAHRRAVSGGLDGRAQRPEDAARDRSAARRLARPGEREGPRGPSLVTRWC